MHFSQAALSLPLAVLSAAFVPAAAAKNYKRGLVFTPNSTFPGDNSIWVKPPTDLSWYYNYDMVPSPAFAGISQKDFEFIPMLWGASDPDDTRFFTTVRDLVKVKGINITTVMSFNEPDGPTAWGGSDMLPSLAAKSWVKNIIPLQKMGIKAGLPACTGGWGGVPWLRQFLGNCSQLISTGGQTQNCTYDFVPIHWYGNFDGLASHIGTYAAAFPNTSIWVTEYNYDNQPLGDTQWFFNASLNYLDKLSEIGRYTFFGAFRSHVSNVGPNGAMLSSGGQLTDIGNWYLGRPAAGVLPGAGSPNSAANLLSRQTIVLGVTAAGVVALAVAGF